MKFAVIGYSGSGKSTLAERLGAQYAAEVLYLDTVHWLPGWTERPREESRAIVEAFLDSQDAWVIDGNYFSLSFERRMAEADRIIFLSFNRFSCLYRAAVRNWRYKGKTRASITEGCPEKIDREFIWWILHKGRTRRQKARYRGVLEQFPEKVTVIKHQRQLDRFCRELTQAGAAWKEAASFRPE